MTQDINQLKQILQNQTMLRDDLSRQCLKREEIQKNKQQEFRSQITQLQLHIKSLDVYIKRLSLVHSQISASSSYPLSKDDYAEILRLVSTM